jgi:hypothetical protein
MCPTVLGRLETRVFTLIGPAILATILSFVSDNPGWIITIGLYLVMGTVLDVLFYPRVITWQPPWLTFVLAVGEFVLLFVLVMVTDPGNGEPGFGTVAAIVLYWVSWVLAVTTKIVGFPLVSLSWVENGAEFRSVGWSVPPGSEPLPLLALPTPAQERDQLVERVSGVHEAPAQLPPLSGEHPRPVG